MKHPGPHTISEGAIRSALEASGGHRENAAKILGITVRTLYHKISGWERVVEDELSITPPPSGDMPLAELVKHRQGLFLRKRAHEEAAKLIPVKVKIPGPIGLLAFGDPHVDDDGTDLLTLERHAHLVRDTTGLFGCNVGDTTNNWVGRLARLYGNQETSAATAWRLAEWFIKLCPRTPEEDKARPPWLFIVGGNHDAWSGAGDPLIWLSRQAGAIYTKSQVRLGLNFANGQQVRVNCAHDFSGASMWNPAHGSMRAAQMGFRDHLLLNGHRHTSGYGLIKCPASGLISHCVQVASYKVYDEYAKDKGLIDRHISPAVVVVIDPASKSAAGLVTVFFDVDHGVDFLRWKREKAA